MRLSTALVITGMFIISLYALIEVSFYSSQITVHQRDVDSPVVEIPSLNLTENINNRSVFYGVYHEPRSYTPGNRTVILFGHRTLYGSPFLKLDRLRAGDEVYLNWPGIGLAEYRVNRSFIVPESYQMSVKQGARLFLITCHPPGSTRERLIVECKLVRITPYQKSLKVENPRRYYALLIITGFLIGGLFITRIYPVSEDKRILLAAVIGLTLFLILGYIFPVPPEFISDKLSEINSMMGI
ncbi:sortase [Methanothermobacter wolfeii]|uniref:Sortase n=1 Tax=Methanothermobacter wolfeii TaxID=145261 RepID=A0ABU8TTI5_METWO